MNEILNLPVSTELPATIPPATSPRRIAARRANAKKSTGPRTPHGKTATRLNALKHGFFAREIVNSVLDGSARAEEFNSILDLLLEEYQPQSSRERILVEEVATSCWRVRRLLRYECRESWVDEDADRREYETERPSDTLLTSMGFDHYQVRLRTSSTLRRSGLDAFMLPSSVDVDKIVRYERSIKRNLYQALETLERIRSDRDSAQSSDAISPPTARLSNKSGEAKRPSARSPILVHNS